MKMKWACIRFKWWLYNQWSRLFPVLFPIQDELLQHQTSDIIHLEEEKRMLQQLVQPYVIMYHADTVCKILHWENI